ncbi:MAG TPA: GtrA family protein [Desulfonatronum sp.]|nr:GtrA family protein [Desulfonatronum sp.]
MDHQKNRSLIQFIRFNIIGATNVALTTSLYFLLIYLGWHYVLALSADYAFGICYSFYMNKRFTFRVRTKASTAMFGKMLATYALVFAGNLVLLAFCVDVLGINPYLSQVLSYGLLMIVAFFMQKFFVFRTAPVRH